MTVAPQLSEPGSGAGIDVDANVAADEVGDERRIGGEELGGATVCATLPSLEHDIDGAIGEGDLR